jgi:molybdate transport repressor ModE-like protein
VRLEPRHLRILLSVSDHGSISAAARAAGLSQPALTNQLHRIEKVCGFPVFERHAGGVRPTERGRAVLGHARRIVGQIAELRASLAEDVDGHALRVAAAPGLLDAALPPLVRRHPDLSWTVDHGGAEAATDAVRRGESDLAVLLRWPGDPPPADDLVRHEVTDAPVTLLVPERSEARGLAELADRAWIVRHEAGAQRLLDQVCERAGFVPQVRLTVTDPRTLVALVAGTGMAALDLPPTGTVTGVDVLPCPEAGRVRTVIAHRRSAVPDGVIEDLRTLLSESA